MDSFQNNMMCGFPAVQCVPPLPIVDIRSLSDQIEGLALQNGKMQATLALREGQLEAAGKLWEQDSASYILSKRGIPILVFADQISKVERLHFHVLFEREDLMRFYFKSGRTFDVTATTFDSDKKLAQAFAMAGVPINTGHGNFRLVMSSIRAEICSVLYQNNIPFYFGWTPCEEKEETR